MAVSVVMTSYNGTDYADAQIRSILANLSDGDELIISDDGSTDGTLSLLSSFTSRDPRIRLLKGPGQGVKKNVENALRAAAGDYIFLADQDDIWSKNKVRYVLDAFRSSGAKLIVHDAYVTGPDGKEIILPSFFSHRRCGKGFIKNTMRNTYIGCCMAFDRALLPYILPIPPKVEMHDQWIGLMAEKHGFPVLFLRKKLLRYRRHGDNTSSLTHYPLVRMFTNRLHLLAALAGR